MSSGDAIRLIEDARSSVCRARHSLDAGGIADCAPGLREAVQSIGRLQVLLGESSDQMHRELLQARLAELSDDVAQVGLLMDCAAAFYRGVAGSVGSAGISYDPAGNSSGLPLTSPSWEQALQG